MQHVSLIIGPPEVVPSASPTFLQPLLPFISAPVLLPSNRPPLALRLLLLPSRLRPAVDWILSSAAENALPGTSAPAPPPSSLLGLLRQLEKRRANPSKILSPSAHLILAARLSPLCISSADIRVRHGSPVSLTFSSRCLGQWLPMRALLVFCLLCLRLPRILCSGRIVDRHRSAPSSYRASGRLVDWIFGHAVKSPQSSCLIFFASLFFPSSRRSCFD